MDWCDDFGSESTAEAAEGQVIDCNKSDALITQTQTWAILLVHQWRELMRNPQTQLFRVKTYHITATGGR